MFGDWSSKVSRNYDQRELRKSSQDQRKRVSSEGADERQSSLSLIIDGPQEALKEAVGVGEDWVDGALMVPKNSVTGVNFSDPRQSLPDIDAAPGVNLALDMGVDPYNLLGAGVFSKGSKLAKEAAEAAITKFGPDAGKGSMLSSLANYIDNHYGPTDVAEEVGSLDNLLTGLMPNTFKTAKDAQAALSKPIGFAKWSFEGLKNVVMDSLDPKARALYKSKGITPGSQRYVGRALADNEIHKATAQVQYASHIPQQSGRVGNTAASVENIMKKSGVSDYFMYVPGSYKESIKANKLKPTQNGKTTPISDNDLDIVENHFGRVWKASDSRGNQVPFNESESPILFIKAPGNGTQTGDHYNDLVNSGWISDMSKVFQETNGKPTVEQLWTQMSKNKKIKLSSDSDTLEKARKNGIWLTGSKKGRAYTEGGINFLVNVKPNGNVIMVMSDEHNFAESIAEKGDDLVRKVTRGKKETGANLVDQMERALPNRLVAVTPPMQANIFNLRPRQFPGMGTKEIKNATTGKGAVSKSDLEAFVNEAPSKEAVDIETKASLGRMQQALGAGMLTGNASRDR